MTDKRRKPQKFVPNSYARSDDWAISRVKAFLTAKGYVINEKKFEDFDIDITAVKDGKVESFEVETKTGYSFSDEATFPFETVSFLARKKKWASYGFWYVIVCRETLAFLMCNSKDIYQKKYLEILNIDSAERKGRDYFYRVPKNKCHWYKLNE